MDAFVSVLLQHNPLTGQRPTLECSVAVLTPVNCFRHLSPDFLRQLERGDCPASPDTLRCGAPYAGCYLGTRVQRCRTVGAAHWTPCVWLNTPLACP